MELIYTYINRVGNIRYELGFNYDSNYTVDYDNNTNLLNIESNDKKKINGFYGKNIDNVNLIVGKNGSGKTGLLNSIGLNMNNAFFHASDSWFSIYYLEDNKYYIEGNYWWSREENRHLPGVNSSNLTNISYDYHLVFDYNLEGKFFIEDTSNGDGSELNRHHFVQGSETDVQRKILYLYKPVDYDSINSFLSPTSIGIKRVAIEQSNVEFYKFLCDDYQKKLDYIPDKKGFKWNIELKELDIEIEETEDNKKFNIYGIGNLAFKYYDTKLLTKMGNQSPNAFNKAIESLPAQEAFALNLLEKLVLRIWNSKFHRSYESEWKKREIDSINSVELKSFKYTDLKKYLLNVFEKLFYYETNEVFKPNMYLITQSVANIEKLNAEYFQNQEIISIALNKSNKENKTIVDLITNLDEMKIQDEWGYMDFIKSTSPSLSTGEKQLAIRYSSVISEVKKQSSHNDLDKIIILLDEPDSYLHPEWARNFLDGLLKYINNIETNVKCHIIISSHSPFFVSDVLSEDILMLTSDKSNRFVSESTVGFGSNISDILADSFFMDYTIGEYSRKYIRMLFDIFDKLEIVHSNAYPEFIKKYPDHKNKYLSLYDVKQMLSNPNGISKKIKYFNENVNLTMEQIKVITNETISNSHRYLAYDSNHLNIFNYLENLIDVIGEKVYRDMLLRKLKFIKNQYTENQPINDLAQANAEIERLKQLLKEQGTDA